MQLQCSAISYLPLTTVFPTDQLLHNWKRVSWNGL